MRRPDVDLMENPAPTVPDAVDRGWEAVQQCRAGTEDARGRVFDHPLPALTTRWSPLSVGHGDVGLALVYSAADQMHPEGGWDRCAHHHVERAVLAFREELVGVGLFSGTEPLSVAPGW